MATTVLALAVAVGLLWLAWRCAAEIRVVLRRRADRTAGAERAARVWHASRFGDRPETGPNGAPREVPAVDPTDATADAELVELLQQYVQEEERGARLHPDPEPNIVRFGVVGAVLLIAALALLAGGIYLVAR
ncbi:hypothetical protein OG216_12740 [Streptomycetaceae bacterium NBC_01309]